jgi:hypothetical protein
VRHCKLIDDDTGFIEKRIVMGRLNFPYLVRIIETVSGDIVEAETRMQHLREVLSYITDHTGSDDIRASFLAQPALAPRGNLLGILSGKGFD